MERDKVRRKLLWLHSQKISAVYAIKCVPISDRFLLLLPTASCKSLADLQLFSSAFGPHFPLLQPRMNEAAIIRDDSQYQQ